MPTLYGIKNCDTIKKARAWLDDHAIAYDFHDYRVAGIDRGTLESWVAAVGLGFRPDEYLALFA